MISFVVATVGRESLERTLASIETWPGDEILVVGERLREIGDARDCVRVIECPRGNDWGHSERNHATPLARGRYLAHIDDDDVYAAGARGFMSDAIHRTPGRPVIFRMRFPNGLTLWQDRELRCGNLGTPCFLIPNVPHMLGTWAPRVGGDFDFLASSRWRAEDYVWRPEIVAHLGHDIS